jgi:hypothetical protein
VQIRRFASLEEVAKATGVHLPQPEGYRLDQNIIGQPDVNPSVFQAVFFAPEAGYIYLDVVFPPVWESGPPSGGLRATTIGKWDGLIIADDEYGKDFAFECSRTMDGKPVWCVASAPNLGVEVLEDFVTSIR